jgi:hypothetical protein
VSHEVPSYPQRYPQRDIPAWRTDALLLSPMPQRGDQQKDAAEGNGIKAKTNGHANSHVNGKVTEAGLTSILHLMGKRFLIFTITS